MPEMSEAAILRLGRYENLGTPEEIQKKRTALEADNQRQRGEIATLKQQVPAEGAVVLTEEGQKKLWAKVKDLPEDFDPAAVVRERDELKVKDATRTRLDDAREAAKATYGNDDAADVLLGLDGMKDGTYEKKQVTVKGQNGAADTKVDEWHFTPAGEGQKSSPLKDYVAGRFSKVEPLLAAKAAAPATGARTTTTTSAGVTVPAQRSGDGSAPVTTVTDDTVRETKLSGARAGL